MAGLPLEAVRQVLEELDRGWDQGDPAGAALRASLAPPSPGRAREDEARQDEARREVEAFLLGLDWTVEGYEPHLHADTIASSLVQVRRHLFPDDPVEALAPYARLAWLLSEVEYAKSPGGPRVPRGGDDLTGPTRRAVLGSLLFGRIVSALRNAANAMRSIRITADLPLPPAEDRRPPDDAGV